MKRVLHILGIILGGIIVALVILGATVPQVTCTTTHVVQAPVDETWATFIDGDRVSEWMPEFSHFEHLSGELFEAGSRHRLHFVDGRTIEETVTEVVPEKRYAFEMDMPNFTASGVVTFTEEGDRTRFVQAVTLQASAFHWRAILPVIKPVFQSQQMNTLEALADLVERNPTSAATPLSPLPAETPAVDTQEDSLMTNVPAVSEPGTDTPADTLTDEEAEQDSLAVDQDG